MSAIKRAEQKFKREAYAKMPSEGTFRAATDYEKTRQAPVSDLDTTLMQRAQFAGMVLGNENVEKACSKEQFELLRADATEFFHALIVQSTTMIGKRDELMAAFEEEEEDDEPDQKGADES